MKLFKRKKTDANPVPEDLKPYYSAKGGGASRWIKPILRGVLLLVLVGLLVWGGIWSVSKLLDRGNNKAASSSSQTATANKDAASTPTKTTTPAPSPAPATSSTPTPKPAATPAPAATPSPAPTTTNSGTSTTASPSAAAGQQLANTGPGEVIALFIGASLVGATIYRLRLTAKLR